MQLWNTKYSFGLVAIFFHWFMAILIVGLFIIGIYMVELDYYHAWYNAAPWWHKSLGMLVLMLLPLRLLWSAINQRPLDLPGFWLEKIIGRFTHYALYLLLTLVCISGYLVTTAKGADIDIFGWFTVPAIAILEIKQAKLVGDAHALTSYLLGLFFSLHMVASFKHHYSDQDVTLKRMLKPGIKGEQ